MKFFSVDGPLYKLLSHLVALVEVNLLWLLCSLPIVTLGGATVAAFDVCMKLAGDEEGHVAADFLRSFRANFKNGIPYGLLLLLCGYVVWLDFSLFEQIPGNPMLLLIMGILAAFVFLISFLYAFALQARYENTLVNTLKNSADISMKFFLKTLLLIVALAVQVFLFCWNSFTLTLAFLLGPACLIYSVSLCARQIFRQLEQMPGAVSNPEKLDSPDEREEMS